MENVSQKLSKNYYGTKMLSVSSVRLFAQNPARALDNWNGVFDWFTDDSALLYGQYVHSGLQDFLTGSHELEKFRLGNPKIFKKNGDLLAKYAQAKTVLNALIESTPLQKMAKMAVSNQYKLQVETPFHSKYKSVGFKGKMDAILVDKKNKVIHAFDFKTSKNYDQSGVDWGTLFDGTRKKCSVAWHADKAFAWQAGTYRQLLRDNGYADYSIDYTYIVGTKEASPRIDVWVISPEAMDLGFQLFASNLLLADKYIKGEKIAPVIFDGSQWANQKTIKKPNILEVLPFLPDADTESENLDSHLGHLPSFGKKGWWKVVIKNGDTGKIKSLSDLTFIFLWKKDEVGEIHRCDEENRFEYVDYAMKKSAFFEATSLEELLPKIQKWYLDSHSISLFWKMNLLSKI